MHEVDITQPDLFDVAIVGGGVIGCALARRFTLDGATVVLLEKAPDILDGASKGNSGILHTGFDAPPGSLEAACIAEGYREYLEIRERLNLPVIRCGALVIAWTDEETAALPGLVDQAIRNGVADVEPLTAAETRRLEPGLGAGLRASFRVPREYLIDPWAAPHAYLLQAIVNGAWLRRGCEVTGGDFDGTAWRLATTLGSIRARVVVNAAGLYGDILDERLIGRRDFTIRPRKGQFVVYDKPAASLASHILLPVPGKTTKGIVVCRTAYGNLLVGPTAEDQEDRREAALEPETLRALSRRGEEILPALAGHDVTAIYAGLRPATEFKDYQIRLHADRNYVTVGGIRSTGLSSALGTARHVHGLCAAFGFSATPLAEPAWPMVGMMCETEQRDWQRPGNGGIVCHCERVTRREVEEAITGPLAAGSLAGVKRRTRVTMGRCQGFYCTADLAAMTRDRLVVPMAGGGHGA
ncbi:NAD(P)/FAD-dependent oxidoreductase [Chthonobacter albigriseus]|uniref:NAD(P)/FAD-dependent oxidoreductase n=1 Tax=Chthonobacter albigriseus TaxID=1683161 RepID=UPI0015EF6884|nr:NAD(P)/FAD-dependent oxidoreductase [Chthonobacter albigriseus]